MKAMMLCLSPKECCNLMIGDLSILVRKKFHKDYVGLVYVYVTNDERKKLVSFPHPITNKTTFVTCTPKEYLGHLQTTTLNGKVIASFWCDNVEEIKWELPNKLIFPKNMLENACLSGEELYKYLGEKGGYAIHITKLEILDKPKEISEFRYAVCPKTNCEYCKYNKTVEGDLYCTRKTLTHAPKTFCYVKI